MKSVPSTCPGRGKMAINLIEAKFTDTTKQPRKIKCTRNPLKLIIKEEGEKSKNDQKSGSSSEKPTNLFQNILKNTKFRLPKKLHTPKKEEIKTEIKKELKKDEELKKAIVETKPELPAKRPVYETEKLNEKLKTKILEPQVTKPQETKPQETSKQKLPETASKTSSNVISKVFSKRKSSIESPKPPEKPPTPPIKTRFSWSTETVEFSPKFQEFPELYLARFCEEQATKQTDFNLSFGDELQVPDQEATISESNGFFKPFKLLFDKSTRKHLVNKELLELALFKLKDDVKLVMNVTVKTVGDVKSDSGIGQSSKNSSRRGSLSDSRRGSIPGLSRKPSFTESLKSLTSSMASLSLGESKKDKRRDSEDSKIDLPEPIVTCSQTCTVLIKMQQGEIWISCHKI